MEQERRSTARIPFNASAEIVDLADTRFKTRVTELSRDGCYLNNLTALKIGTPVIIKIASATDFFEAHAQVASVHSNLGTGLSFLDVEPPYLPVLQKWLVAANPERK